MKDFFESMMAAERVRIFLAGLGEAGRVADKVSDLILFHLRVQENAKKVLLPW